MADHKAALIWAKEYVHTGASIRVRNLAAAHLELSAQLEAECKGHKNTIETFNEQLADERKAREFHEERREIAERRADKQTMQRMQADQAVIAAEAKLAAATAKDWQWDMEYAKLADKLAAVEAETIERCAKVCAENRHRMNRIGNRAGGDTSGYLENAILALRTAAQFLVIDEQLYDATKHIASRRTAATQELPVSDQSPGRDAPATSMGPETQHPAPAAAPDPALPGLELAAKICDVIASAGVGSTDWNKFDEVTAAELGRRIRAEIEKRK